MKSKDDSRWLCKRRTMQAGRSWEEQRSCGGYSQIQIDFFFPLSRWRNLHTAGFFVSTLTMPIMGGGCIFAHNIWDVDHCLLSKVKCRHRSKVVTHPVSVICSSINPSINQSPMAQAAECGHQHNQHKPVSAFAAFTIAQLLTLSLWKQSKYRSCDPHTPLFQQSLSFHHMTRKGSWICVNFLPKTFTLWLKSPTTYNKKKKMI